MKEQQEETLVNRVAESGLVTINLETWFPAEEIVPFDLKPFLFMELLLKEKDFREAMKAYDWSSCRGKVLCVFCSSDAIIPMWAYMLVASHAAGLAADVYQGSPEAFISAHYKKVLSSLDTAAYQDQRIVIKGCGDKPVPAEAYLEITRILQPHAQSILYGEPCSTVPIFKRPRKPE